jgi:hypothetical protein
MRKRKKCNDCTTHLCVETNVSLAQLQKNIVKFLEDNAMCSGSLQVVVDINPCPDGCHEGKYTIGFMAEFPDGEAN